MKDKIIYFLIGLLAGAVISTGSIFIYTLAAKEDDAASKQSSMEMRSTPPSDMNGGQMNGGTPPARPDDNSQSENQ